MIERRRGQIRSACRAIATRQRVGALAALALVAGLATGCGSGAPATHASVDRVPQEASVRVGDVIMRASAMPTETLGEAVAAQYGIHRDSGTVMLLVGVRRGSDADEQALSARITASATDLLGKRQPIGLREVRVGDYVDYVGTAAVIVPDTIRFDVEARVDGTAPLSLQFNRDFFPR